MLKAVVWASQIIFGALTENECTGFFNMVYTEFCVIEVLLTLSRLLELVHTILVWHAVRSLLFNAQTISNLCRFIL